VKKIAKQDQDLTTVLIYWQHVLPLFQPPLECYLRSWLRIADVETVMGAFDYCSDAIADGHFPRSISADSIGRHISAMLRRRKESLQVSA